MQLFHTTPVFHLMSIKKHGLLPTRSMTRRQEVWLHHEPLIEWARKHGARRHHFAVDEMATVTVFVPYDWLERRAQGLFTVNRIIEPGRIRGLPVCHKEFLRTLHAIRLLQSIHS